jgi:peptide/nickel transport system substrate-binding protein
MRAPRLRMRALSAMSVGLLVMLTGCTSTNGTPAPASEAASSGGTSAADGGTIVVGLPVDPDTLVPWKALKINTVKVVQLLYSTITQFDSDMKVLPGLAKSWKVSSDSLTVTFALEDGVTFSDGAKLTSADVKYSLEKILDPETAAVSRSDLASIKTIDAPDPLTVVVHLSAPDAALPTNLAQPTMSIVPSGATEEQLATKPDGSGPFVMSARITGQSITLVKNEHYWVQGQPKLTGVDFRVIPDQSSLASALQAGSVDLVAFDDPLVAQSVESSTVKVVKTLEQHYHAIILNSFSAALSDVNVRLAIQCAIDRQELIDSAVAGAGQLTGPINTQPYASDPNKQPCPTRDLAKAADYLAKAGKSGGVTVNMVVSSDLYATGVDEAQNIKSQLAAAKITVNLQILESGAYVAAWSDPNKRDAVLVLAGGNSPDPDSLYGSYFGANGSRAKVAGYTSPELQQLFAEGKASSDETTRKGIYDQISAHLVDQGVWIWLFTSYDFTGTSSRVQGFVPTPTGSFESLVTTTVD